MDTRLTTSERALEQIDAVMKIPATFIRADRVKVRAPEFSEVTRFYTAALACVERLAGRNSVYFEQATRELNRPAWNAHDAVVGILGVFSSFRADIEAGYLDSVKQEVKRAVASDFLSLAESFIEEDRNNKPLVTAAAVLAGGVLEEHIRHLCEKHGIDPERANNKGDTVRKNVNRLSGELRSAQAYEQIDHDNVLSWYRIRTHAAHAEYEKYDAGRVEYMIMGLRRFISDYAA